MGRVVMVHKEFGIYLGSCLGLGFWSKLDPAGQDAAVTFDNEQHGLWANGTWDSSLNPEDLSFVEVGQGEYASIAECVAVGLEAWDPNQELAQCSRCGPPSSCNLLYSMTTPQQRTTLKCLLI